MLMSGSCSADRVLADDEVDDNEPTLPDGEPHVPKTLHVLKLRTFDGSGQTIHPDFAQATRWTSPMLLVATPYHGGNEGLENPSLYTRGRDFEWSPVSKEASPLARPIRGHLSDPDMVSIPGSNEVWIYYRQANKKNRVYLVRTNDGREFTAPVEVTAGPNHSIVSPAVVRRSSTRWLMWSVNAGPAGCRATSTKVELRKSSDGKRWTKPAAVSLGRPGSFVWHLDVQWIPSRKEYWALYNAKMAGSCDTRALFLATSQDGKTWHSYPSPVIQAGVIPEFSDIVYRSTFAYDASTDAVRLWYSGARMDEDGYFIWQSAFDRRNRAELFQSIGDARVNLVRLTSSTAAAYFDAP